MSAVEAKMGDTSELMAANSTDTEGKGEAGGPEAGVRAAVLTGFGGLKAVKVVKRAEPTLADGEVLMRVQLCGVSFQDVMVRQGVTEAPPKTPFVMGFECAGIIESIAEDVVGFKVGERVVALPDLHGWAELVTVPAKYVYSVPDSMPLPDALAITLSYAVAYMLVHEVSRISKGQSVLLHSAGGAVGQAICALCQLIGGVNVIGVASKEKHETIKDTLTHLIERGSDLTSEVKKIFPGGVDVVLDSSAGEECNRGYSLLQPMGKYIIFGSSSIVTGETKSFFSVAKTWWQIDKISPLRLYDENKTVAGFNFRRFLHQQTGGAEKVRQVVDTIYQLWKDGKVKAHVDSTHALEDVTDAMAILHERKNVGKILLDLSMEAKPKVIPATKTKKEDKKDTKEEDATTDKDDVNGEKKQ